MNIQLNRSTVVKKLFSITSTINKEMDNSLSMIHGIGLTEYLILSKLDSAPNSQMRRIDIASSVGLTASAITRRLSPMIKIGLIEKEVNTRDARVSLVKLTTTGARLFNEATVTFDNKSDDFLNHLDQNDLDKLVELLK